MAFVQAADAIEMAMGIERSGEAFYRTAAKRTQSAEARALFEDLAKQEMYHYATFARLSEAIGDKLLMSDDEWDEYQKYLEATVQSVLFEGPDRALAAAEEAGDEKEALHMAIGFEKETMLFFYHLRDVVPDADHEMVDRIVAEEKAHVRRLADML